MYNSIAAGTLTDRIDSEVMAIERIGNLIYVGGKFTDVRQTPRSAPVNQQFLAAFDARTRAHVSSFDVDLSGPVYALQASPDGSRRFVAAYSALDGSYQPSFQLNVSGSSGVWGMTSGPDGCMWFGGDLTRATRANGTNQARGGFTKHCDTSMVTDTIKPSVPTNFTAVASGNNAVLNWAAATGNVGRRLRGLSLHNRRWRRHPSRHVRHDDLHRSEPCQRYALVLPQGL